MTGLSEIQVCAIRYAQCSRISYEYFCDPDDSYRKATLEALVKKGYLHPSTTVGLPYWLTDKGNQLREELNKRGEHDCVGCGAETDPREAACRVCGELKEFA